MKKETFPVGKRVPKNPSEAEFFEIMRNKGWEISKMGFPDFACYKDNRFILVEIKPKRAHKLKREQYKVMLSLSRYGVPCFKWSPDDGVFEQIIPDIDKITEAPIPPPTPL